MRSVAAREGVRPLVSAGSAEAFGSSQGGGAAVALNGTRPAVRQHGRVHVIGVTRNAARDHRNPTDNHEGRPLR
jgi:hypothetical protein